MSPTDSSASPESHIFGIPGWAEKKLHDPRGVVWQLKAVAIHNHPLNCQSGGSLRLVNTCSQVGSVPMSAKESAGGGYMDIQLTVDQTRLTQAQLFLTFLVWAFAPKLNELIQSFNSWPMFPNQWPPIWVTLMIRRLELVSKLRATPSHHWMTQHGPKETEVFGSTPSHSPSQFPVRKLTPDHPWTQYCLEIQVISTEDGETTPPPPHTWQAPVVEDMVWDGKSSLTEAVVMGPGWAVLFYGWWSLGEGLSLGEV